MKTVKKNARGNKDLIPSIDYLRKNKAMTLLELVMFLVCAFLFIMLCPSAFFSF